MLKLKGRRGIKWKLLPIVHVGFRALGFRWRDFYRWMLDRKERNLTLEYLLRPREKSGIEKGLYDLRFGQRHVDYMTSHGLRRDHKVLDFGCGFGRTGIPLAKYLDAGNYYGVDLSTQRIRLAKEWGRHEKLEPKDPQFIDGNDNNLTIFADHTFDVIFSRAVFAHMPLEDFEDILAAWKRILKPNGFALFDHNISEIKKNYSENLKDFYIVPEMVDDILRKIGFNFESLSDWYEAGNANDAGRARMLRITIAD